MLVVVIHHAILHHTTPPPSPHLKPSGGNRQFYQAFYVDGRTAPFAYGCKHKEIMIRLFFLSIYICFNRSTFEISCCLFNRLNLLVYSNLRCCVLSEWPSAVVCLMENVKCAARRAGSIDLDSPHPYRQALTYPVDIGRFAIQVSGIQIKQHCIYAAARSIQIYL